MTAHPSGIAFSHEILGELVSVVVQQVMAKLRPEDNANPYRPADYSPVPKGFKPNRFALQRHVAPEDVQITTALDQYFHEHLHRTPAVVCQIEKTIVDFLETNDLEAKNRLRLITKPLCRHWKEKLLASGNSPVTVKRKFGFLNHFLKWCYRQEYLTCVPSDGLELPARMVADARKRRTSFTPEELTTILNDPWLREKQYGPRPIDKEQFWAVMMLAYSGARCGEVVKLYRSNIQQESGTGIWFMELENDPEEFKRVKNRFSLRKVPLHSALLKLGLLEWVQSSGTSKWLFPATMDKANPAAAISSKFKYMRDEREPGGKADRSKTLHSLRHTMTVLLKKARVDDGIRHKILGHAQGNNVEDTVYLEGLTYELKELQEGLERVILPVDFEWKAAPL
jgi:integrase